MEIVSKKLISLLKLGVCLKLTINRRDPNISLSSRRTVSR
jgi:hypothetical protein